MKDLAIYGAGGIGREVACLIQNINKFYTYDKANQWNLIGFFDDGKEKGFRNEYGKVLGSIDDLNSWNTPLSVCIAIGEPKDIEIVANKISNPMISFPNIVSPDSIFLDDVNIILGKGNIICYGCLLSCNVKIGDFNVFNWKTTIGHDTEIGNYNVLMPNVKVSGGVVMGNRNLLGVGSVVIQLCRIGNESIITSNSVLYGNAKDGKTYMGNPAKKIKIM